MRVEELPIDPRIKRLLVRQGISELYPPQWEALNSGVLKGKNLVMASPTASGKTLVAEVTIADRILRDGGKALYLTPLKAIAAEKYKEFKRYEELGLKVAMTTGDYDSSDPQLAKYDIIISTNEKADSLIRHEAPWLTEVDIVVVDEIHYIDDPKRGPVIESVISRVKRWDRSQIIGLSATISNAAEIAEWIGGILVYSEWRPVPLREGVYYEGKIVYDDGSTRAIRRETGDAIADLTIDTVKEGGQALIFTNARNRAVSLALKLSRILRKTLRLEEQAELRRLSRELASSSEYSKLNEKLAEASLGGTCFHHAGLSYVQRSIIEEAFRSGVLKAIVATPTLAAGVNLPARRVIVQDYTRYEYGLGRQPIKVLEYKQFAGRAGRPMYDEYGEAILIAKNPREADLLFDLYIYSSPENIMSKLGSEPSLRSQLLALIATSKGSTLDDIMDFIENTLFYLQYGGSGIDRVVRRVLRFLEREELIRSRGGIYMATRLGVRTAQLYIDPLTTSRIVRALRRRRLHPSHLSLLLLICSTPDMPKLHIRRSDVNSVEEFIDHHYDAFIEPPEEREDVEYEVLLSEVKTAMLLYDWINEVPEDTISERYDIGPGDLYNLVETADWLLYATGEISKLVDMWKHVGREVESLRIRIRYGVREELTELVRLEGVGRVRARMLYNAGYRSLEDLMRARVEDLMRVRSIGKEIALKIKRQLGQNVDDKSVKEGILDYLR